MVVVLVVVLMVVVDVEVVILPIVSYVEQMGILHLHVPNSTLMPLMHLLQTQIQLKLFILNATSHKVILIGMLTQEHISSFPDHISQLAPYSGNMDVLFGNYDKLPISHTSNSMISKNLSLCGVLVVPNLTKNLLSISKLTTDHPVVVHFSRQFFNIQYRARKQVIA